MLFCAKGSRSFRGRIVKSILPVACTGVTNCSCGCNCHSISWLCGCAVACMLFGHVFTWQELDNMSCSDVTIPFCCLARRCHVTHVSHTCEQWSLACGAL